MIYNNYIIIMIMIIISDRNCTGADPGKVSRVSGRPPL